MANDMSLDALANDAARHAARNELLRLRADVARLTEERDEARAEAVRRWFALRDARELYLQAVDYRKGVMASRVIPDLLAVIDRGLRRVALAPEQEEG